MFEKSLLEELLKFTKKDTVRAHMPGSNGGTALSGKFKRNAFKVDLTELSGTDNLQNPQGIIKKSLKRAEKAFGAEKTYYLVNGSTVGLEAAILAVTKPGDTIIVDRACHKSVIAALILAHVTPVFVEPEFSEKLGIYVGITPEAVAVVLLKNPSAAGVVLTSPTYYGVCLDVGSIASVVHNAGKVLIVDEAHGAHFAFSDKLPKTALSLGADIVVQSAHKTLPALGQTALLHIGNTDRVSEDAVTKCVNLLQTSSPSYIMLASLDEAISHMSAGGKDNLDKIIEKLVEVKSKIGVINKLSCITSSDVGCEYDITKLVIDVSRLSISGHGAAELLKRDYGIYPEMSDERSVLLYFTAGTTMRDLEAVDRAVSEIANAEFRPQDVKTPSALPGLSLEMPMYGAFFGEAERVPISKAESRICAEILNCCPPCIPLCIPGQRIDESVCGYISEFTDISDILVVK